MGLRLVEIWLPDVQADGFREEARRQALMVAAADARDDDQDFVESISVDWGPE